MKDSYGGMYAVMYHSESGGCCDCGDRAAWKESGYIRVALIKSNGGVTYAESVPWDL